MGKQQDPNELLPSEKESQKGVGFSFRVALEDERHWNLHLAGWAEVLLIEIYGQRNMRNMRNSKEKPGLTC